MKPGDLVVARASWYRLYDGVTPEGDPIMLDETRINIRKDDPLLVLHVKRTRIGDYVLVLSPAAVGWIEEMCIKPFPEKEDER